MKSKFCSFLSAFLALCMFVSCSKGTEKPENTTGSTQKSTESSTTATPGVVTTPVETDEYLVQSGNDYTLYSPDRTVAIKVNTEGQLSYSVTRTRDGADTEWVRPSAMGVSMANKKLFKDVTVHGTQVNEVKATLPLYGNQSIVEGSCIEAVLSFDTNDCAASEYKLEIRAYDNGVAFRYVVPGSGSNRNLKELTTYALRDDVTECWYGVNNQDYEAVIESHKPSEKSDAVITAPLTAVVNRGTGYIALMEGALTDSYPGVNLKAEGDATYSTCFYTTPTVAATDSMTTGWRLINIADSLNDLVNNYNIYTVNEQPGELYGNTDWIEPGRSAWSWCTTHGAPTPALMREYTLAAALLGYEYNIIDDGWPAWTDYKNELASLGALGKELNVKQLLWGAITAGTSGYNKTPDKASVDAYMKLLEDTGMVGAKVDFWWSDANVNTTVLQKYILEEAAKRQFIIDFHGCNKNTGLNATYPNELSREGVRGLENIGNSNTTNYTTYASWLNAQLYTRYLCGHADWTPGTYNAMEIASLICIDSPLMVVASNPVDILASPALEFIKSIPTTWDQTVVLSDSKIGSYSVYAKEKDGIWFVGGIASATKNKASVDLTEFLPEGSGSYTAEIWYDTGSGMECKTVSVSADGKIDIGNLAAGRGFAIRLSKLSLSRYGGEIGTVAVTAPEGATVKYTTDGSDPMTSSTAAVCSGSINVTASCKLRVAITDGEGKGTALSYRFNEINPLFTLTYDVKYDDNKTTVTFDRDDAVTIYYTLDGSTPSASSAKVSAPIEVTKDCTLNYLAVCGERSLTGSIVLTVRTPITIPRSDIPLTDASPIGNPSIGWGSAHYDQSMASDNSMSGRKISLGGSDQDNGTKFDRGISSNAVSTYQYAVPAGVKRFVAVVGIDDCVWANTTDRSKASARLILSFDGVEAYRSEIFRMGEFCYVDIEVPEGASVLTIRFDDAGDGITCDNVSLGAPGWVK